MTVQSKSVIKSYFETGDHPSQAQFIDLIDSYADIGATGTALYTDQGTNNNVYAITVAGVSAYASGQNYAVKWGNINTSAATLNVNNLGAVSITYNDGSSLTGGELPQNGVGFVYHQGGNFRLPNINPSTTGSITAIIGDVSANGPGIATATLAKTTVSAGSYTNPTIVVDAKGRITSATTGSSPSAGAMLLLAKASATGQSVVDFTSVITSAYDSYVLDILNLVPGTDNVDLFLRMSSNNGVSYDSGASDYTSSTGGVSTGGYLNASGALGNSTGENFNAKICFYDPLNITKYKIFGVVSNHYSATPAAVAAQNTIVRTATSACNAFRILPTSGILSTFKMRFYGFKNT